MTKTKSKLYGDRKIARAKAKTASGIARTRPMGKGVGTGLMLMVPRDTLKMLRMRAAETGTTVRALVLEALRKSGYPVQPDELVDRRRRL